MKIKNTDIETLAIQLQGNGIKKDSQEQVPIGLLNFNQDTGYGLKGKLKRSLTNLCKEVVQHYNLIIEEQNRILKIEDENVRQEELQDLTDEFLVISGWSAIPVSWIDEIVISNAINIDFLLNIGVLFDDTDKITSTIDKKEKELNPEITE